MNNERYLQTTPLLNFTHPSIVTLIRTRGWAKLSAEERIGVVYNFVRHEIHFGYNATDALRASTVLAAGYGQCNTKAVLLMAMLRGCGIPCRLHGATVDKRMQFGIMRGFIARSAPDEILHSWVEVWHGGRFVALEGVILDRDYLAGVLTSAAPSAGPYCGYAMAVSDTGHIAVDWTGTDTFIQKEAMVRDLGIFDNPDTFLRAYRQNLSPVKAAIYARIGTRCMNHRVAKIRAAGSRCP
ncbi:MAG: transglutaminase family protein [Eubacteriales bacterium]|nr:transglutaminase family protein [Eubacteriales bacterium]